MHPTNRHLCKLFSILSVLIVGWALALTARAQDTVTGAFEGTVSHSLTRVRIPDATVEIINQATDETFSLRTDAAGRFFQALLPPSTYTIRVSARGFKAYEREQRLFTTAPNQVVPIPIALEPVSGPSAAATPTPLPTAIVTAGPAVMIHRQVVAEMNRTDGRQAGAYTEGEVATLPLGIISLVRSFDELAFLLPGVALPPQTLGSVAGPGVGAGVGSAGQFAVNGLRSRANNFTVDGSDNNDEDIGVRRQGFVALIPQPIESVKEYHVTTLLAPAQFGRNIGAQVNVVSKSGGSKMHGILYGFFNASQLNAKEFFDTTFGTAMTPLRAGNQPVLLSVSDLNGNVLGPPQPLLARNQSGGEDSFTFAQGGFALGGPLEPARGPARAPRMFYFVSAEGNVVNATKEESFAVPTVEQRGAFGAGATGIFRDPFTGGPTATIPSARNGAAIFSLYPFPNNPNGVYGPNTLTQARPASGHGLVLSGKFDGNFKVKDRRQAVTGRYNFTDDARDIPATGGAIFSTLRPRVRTNNFSFFLNSDVSAPQAVRAVFNQLRLSYGRTRLGFDEIRDRTQLIASRRFPGGQFLLNAPELLNITTPPQPGVANTGPVLFRNVPDITVEDEIGPLGQVFVAGFSPIGVDVYNFPQQRVNNTYQVADGLTLRAGEHYLAFGLDWRRSELNSDLPRVSRPLVTFNGAPRLIFENGAFRLPTGSEPNLFIRPEDLVALGAASNFYLTLNTGGGDAKISLRYYQNNFYGQDEWHARRNLVLSYGLRYEYNTPVREVNRRIENTFNSPALDLAPGLRNFIEGRARIFEPDRNNFAPRVGVAFLVNPLSQRYATVVRGGYGIFYDQILGAAVSQSRNVYPTFLTLNFGGLNAGTEETFLNVFNPGSTLIGISNQSLPLVQPGTLNRLNPAVPLNVLLPLLSQIFPAAVGATLPARRLETPMAHHYTLTLEQQLGSDLTVLAAYVGTLGRHLLRFTTPNLGPSSTLVPTSFSVFQAAPVILGRVRSPSRPVGGIGSINRFETTANSHYDSLQLQVRGRFRRGLQYQAAYTFSHATDDVSDVFDLAGASALPQDSFALAAERGPANFDVRHRFTYYFVYDLPESSRRSVLMRTLLGGVQLAGTGSYQTGQPFTVNSIFDVNLDGNLTDRLNTMAGITITGDRRQPLRLTGDPLSLLAPVGQDGLVGRNTLRAGSVIELNLAISKRINLSTRQSLLFRADLFNITNRANFGVPVRLLEAPGFGQATNTVTPARRVQFAVKYAF